MENFETQQENDVVIELSEPELKDINGGGFINNASNVLSGIKGMYRAGKDMRIPKILNAPMALTFGAAYGLERAKKGLFPGSEAVRQRVVWTSGYGSNLYKKGR